MASSFLNTVSENSIVSGPPFIARTRSGLVNERISDTGPSRRTLSEGA